MVAWIDAPLRRRENVFHWVDAPRRDCGIIERLAFVSQRRIAGNHDAPRRLGWRGLGVKELADFERIDPDQKNPPRLSMVVLSFANICGNH
jgi:hypothetical protein